MTLKIKRFVKKHSLPLSVIFKPGQKLKSVFCRSRPRDSNQCTHNKCKICANLKVKDCTCKNPIYLVTCNLCNDGTYIGESSRTAHDRLSEHYNYSNNPNAKSYQTKTFAKHYNKLHPNIKPDLSFDIIDTENNTLMRKIKESFYIHKHKPTINEKEELKDLERYITKY